MTTLCFSDVRFISNQVRECVCFWLTQYELCQFCLNQLELNSCCSAQCVLCRRQSGHQVLVVVVLSLVISSSCARDCVFMTRDILRIVAQGNLMCSSRPTWQRSLCLSMETRLLGLESRLRQTEEAVAAERRASRRTAEVAQQVVRTCPAGVDVEEIGRLEMFSGDGDLNGRVSSMPSSQCSVTVRRYFGDLNQTATR